MAVRAVGRARTVVCPSCLTVGDSADPNVKVVQQSAWRRTPLVPLGARGRWPEGEFEAIGYQYRTIRADGEVFGWEEYLLFNPYRGFRYLTHYEGHWTIARPLSSLPISSGPPNQASIDGRVYRHFQTATAHTSFVLGEFPWRIRVGDAVEVEDFIAPPSMLSRETTDDETTWSRGEYVDGPTVWRAFSLDGLPPPALGVFANQPSPHAGKPARYWRLYALMLALIVAVWVVRTIVGGRQIFDDTFHFDPRPGRDAAIVTRTFELPGRTANTVLTVSSNLVNAWVYFNLALISDDTGEALDVGREVSYYAGVEDGESWTEGSTSAEVVLPTVPPGTYYLRVEPEGPELTLPVDYRVRVVRDRPATLWYVLAAVVLAIPPMVASWRAMTFEAQRWNESDSGGDDAGGSAEDDDDDDDE